MVLCCISSPFGGLSTTRGKITYVLLTRAPLYWGRSPFSHDLHVLGAPLTFVLSQDQTLQLDPSVSRGGVTRDLPPCGSLSSYTSSPDRGDPGGGSLSTHTISRGLMGLSFQGPRGATGFIRFFPSRGAEPSSNLGVCQTSFRCRRRFFCFVTRGR